MRTRSKLIFSAVAAIALLGVAVGSATAGRLSLPNSEAGFRLVWTPLTFEAGGRTVRCNVTLEGSFSRATTEKRASAEIGRVTRGEVESCTGGSARVNTETLPWENTYHSFGGTLPNITTVTLDLVGASFEVHPEGLPQCRATTTATSPGRGIARVEGGEITELRAEEASTIVTEGSNFLCRFGTVGRFIGTAAATVLGGTAHTRITLI